MLFFILYTIVLIVLRIFCEEAKYLADVMFLLWVYWLPGMGDNVKKHKCDRYEYSGEYNNSNPLYIQGCLRKNKKLSMFGSLKGLFVCQLIALVILALAWIYLSVKCAYGKNGFIEFWLLVSCFVLMLGWIGVTVYYRICYNLNLGYVENSKGIWEPFSALYHPSYSGKKENDFRCRYYVGYESMKERLVQAVEEKDYVFFKCYKEDEVKEFDLFIRQNEEILDIFALIHVERMEEDCWDKYNHIFETFWEEKIAEKYGKKQIAFTFLLCVDENSRELLKTRKWMDRECVISKVGTYRLPALLDYSGHSFLKIISDNGDFRRDKRGEKIRRELLEILDVSMELNGKVYPEGGQEEEFWL